VLPDSWQRTAIVPGSLIRRPGPSRPPTQSAVAEIRGGDITDGRGNCSFGCFAQAEKIEVSGRPVMFSNADREQHGSFQHEAVAVFRFRESIQEPLGTVIHERQREVFLPLLRHFQQPRPYGCCDVDRSLSAPPRCEVLTSVMSRVLLWWVIWP
jgi:hypothetical protein